ncbi:MAG: LysR family transcriptional regulator [Pseudomonadota bacterium]
MNVTLDQLRAFLAVVQSGGVRKAAESLSLTQPAVTARIKSLEEAVGQPLFDRADKMALTRRGSVLVRYAEQFLSLRSLVERDVSSADGIARLLRIGASETIVQTWLPHFIQDLRAQYPNVSVEIDVDDSLSLRDRLLANGIDLGLMMGPVSDYRVENLSLPRFDMGWFRSPGCPDLSPDAGDPIITFSRSTRPHRELKEQVLERYGPTVPFFPSTSLSAGFRMVAMGLGIGALPLIPAEPFLSAGDIERIELDIQPSPLEFSAAFVAGSDAAFCRQAAEVAAGTAREFHKIFLSK